MFKTRNYRRLVELAALDIRCGDEDCSEWEEPCPYELHGRQCTDFLLEDLGEIMRMVYEDANAMKALEDVAKKNESHG